MQKTIYQLFGEALQATPPYIDHNGKAEFLIDAACFSGSSGSPVFIVNQGIVHDKRGNTNLGGSRVLFLGILFAGPQVTATGRIVRQVAPTSLQPVPVVNMMMNLGICVRAELVLDFEQVLRASGVQPKPAKLLAATSAISA